MLSDKGVVTNRLKALGLQTPATLRVQKEHLLTLTEELERHPQVGTWYLRSEGPHGSPLLGRAVSADEIVGCLSEAFAQDGQLVAILQERVDARTSGCLLVTPDCVLVEYVHGALQSLLRDGAIPCRLLLDNDGNPIRVQESQQELAYFWHGTELVEVPPPTPRALAPSLLEMLMSAARLVRTGSVLEWVSDINERTYFLDHKLIPRSVPHDRACLSRGLDTACLIGLDGLLRGAVAQDPKHGTRAIYALPRPLYANLRTLLHSATAIVVARGAFLSHLIVYAMMYRIPCAVSERLYALLIEQDLAPPLRLSQVVI